MALFTTGLCADDWLQHPLPEHEGLPFRLQYIETERSARSRTSAVLRDGSRVDCPSREIAVESDSLEDGQGACDLVYGCCVALEGVDDLGTDPIISPLLTHAERRQGHPFAGIAQAASWFRGLGAGAVLAVCIAGQDDIVYALAKYMQSLRLHSTYWMDLDPMHGERIAPTRVPRYHVAMAYAITAAYGVVEELGFEVRASAVNPSRPSGQWNEPVRQELLARLSAGGVDVDEPMLWNLRGPEGPLEQGRPTVPVAAMPWSDGKEVRDQGVRIEDAIADVGWLRGRVTAHKLTREQALAVHLTPYDVENAQHLARRLLLARADSWRVLQAQRHKEWQKQRECQ